MRLKKFDKFLAEDYAPAAPSAAPVVAIDPAKFAELGEALRAELSRRHFTVAKQDIKESTLAFKATKQHGKLHLTFRGGHGSALVGVSSPGSTLPDTELKFFGVQRIEPTLHAALSLVAGMTEIERLHTELKANPRASYGDRHGFAVEKMSSTLNESSATKHGMDKFTAYAKHLLRTHNFDQLTDDKDTSRVRGLHVFSAVKAGVKIEVELGEWDTHPYFTCAVLEKNHAPQNDAWTRRYAFATHRAVEVEPLLCGVIDLVDATVALEKMKTKYADDTHEFDALATVKF